MCKKNKNDQIIITAPEDGLHGATIHLKMPSVGATMNIIMASVTAKGQTIIDDAAKEPEIIDLATFLNNMGATIRGAGTDSIRIEGVKELRAQAPHTIIPDRIEAGTYISLAACIGNGIRIHNIIEEHLDSYLAKVEEMGVVIDADEDSLYVYPAGALKMIQIKTAAYPGFATDLQQPITPLLLTAKKKVKVSLLIRFILSGPDILHSYVKWVPILKLRIILFWYIQLSNCMEQLFLLEKFEQEPV